jgi:hypothetical protein
MARKEKEPKTEEEFNAVKIRIGDDLKARTKRDMRLKKDTVTLVRVRKLSDLDYRPDDEESEEDFTLYERDDGGLCRIFVKTMNDTKRMYVDHKTDEDNPFDMEKEPDKYDNWYEKHDNEYTEYFDYEYANDLFKEHKIYQEVK